MKKQKNNLTKENNVIAATARVKSYEVLARAVEEGIQMGWNRAHKHTNTPDTDHVMESVYNEIMNSVCEVFNFDNAEQK